MPSRRIHSLHHGNMEGKNVVFHREHRSKRGKRWGERSPLAKDSYARNGKRSDWRQKDYTRYKSKEIYTQESYQQHL